MNNLTLLRKGIAHCGIILILSLRPILGPATCKFEFTCTRYAVWQLENRPLAKALWAITKRLLQCSPFSYFFCSNKPSL